MKVYLDDERPAPSGWVRTFWPDETIDLLRSQDVAELSLDHDLGDDKRGTGYDVLLWLEQAVFDGLKPPARIVIHSANASAYLKMAQAITKIHQLATRFSEPSDEAQEDPH
jgi:hypothetical protein